MNNRWTLNRQHWEQTLDAQNLGRSGTAVSPSGSRPLQHGRHRYALDGMEPLRDARCWTWGEGWRWRPFSWPGAGPGGRGRHQPAAVQAARHTLRQLGLDGQVDLVWPGPRRCRSGTRPFRDHVQGGAHPYRPDPDDAGAASHPGREGRLFILEPTRGNPFVNLYRRLLAPKMWAHITSYFGPEEDRVIRATLPGRGASRCATSSCSASSPRSSSSPCRVRRSTA